MNKQELLEKINVQITSNIDVIVLCDLKDMLTQAIRDSNNILRDIEKMLKEDTEPEDSYNRGLNDAWELARKIGGLYITTGFTYQEIEEIFGKYDEIEEIFEKYTTCQEALAKVEAYEKKKAEEEAAKKPVRGDVVKVTAKDQTHGYTGVYLGTNMTGDHAFILEESRVCPVCLSVKEYNFKKTGERIDFTYKKEN